MITLPVHPDVIEWAEARDTVARKMKDLRKFYRDNVDIGLKYRNLVVKDALDVHKCDDILKPTKANLLKVAERCDPTGAKMPSFVCDDGYSMCGAADAWCDDYDDGVRYASDLREAARTVTQ